MNDSHGKASRLMLMVILAVAALTACRDASPIVSGQSVREGVSAPLSEHQVGLLNAWLKDHTSGWRLLVVTPPLASFTLAIHHADGRAARLDFFSRDGWKGALILWQDDSSGNYLGTFPLEEVSRLRQEMATAE